MFNTFFAPEYPIFSEHSLHRAERASEMLIGTYQTSLPLTEVAQKYHVLHLRSAT